MTKVKVILDDSPVVMDWTLREVVDHLNICVGPEEPQPEEIVGISSLYGGPLITGERVAEHLDGWCRRWEEETAHEMRRQAILSLFATGIQDPRLVQWAVDTALGLQASSYRSTGSGAVVESGEFSADDGDLIWKRSGHRPIRVWVTQEGDLDSRESYL